MNIQYYEGLRSNQLQLKDEQKEWDARKKFEKKSPSKDSHDQPFNDMHLHDPLQLAMGASLNAYEHATPGLLLYSATATKSKIFTPFFKYVPVGRLLQFFVDRKIMY